ncbi:MAG: hypothetical protein OEY23_16675 [Acidimicrobiia bacterium]|nr:hypothetical protein [Acidimicrobiia bacterium]MDH5236666.1 hypothetical protein [Acidimicrobiia bacterium]
MSDRSSRLVLGWVRFYTQGLPDEAGPRRRAEIESDLWEQCHDPTERAGVALILRCARGVPADLWWRYRTLVMTRSLRSSDMDSSTSWNWWVALTGLITVALIVTGVGAGIDGAGDSAWALTSVVGSLVSGGLILAGLYKRTSDLIAGSWMIVIGALAGGPFGLPVAALIVLSGLWSGNLRFSATTQSEPRLVVARRHQHALTRRWYLWLIVAVAVAGLGFGALYVQESTGFVPDDCGEFNPCWQDTAAWATWALSFLGAMVSAGIAVVLGVAHLFVRRRPTYPQPGPVTST